MQFKWCKRCCRMTPHKDDECQLCSRVKFPVRVIPTIALKKDFMDQKTLKELVSDFATEFLPDNSTHTFRFSFPSASTGKPYIVGFCHKKSEWQTSAASWRIYKKLEDLVPSLRKWAGKAR